MELEEDLRSVETKRAKVILVEYLPINNSNVFQFLLYTSKGKNNKTIAVIICVIEVHCLL